MAATSPSPIAYTIPGSVQASGFSRSAIYRLIQAGELRAVKYGKRTMILHKDLQKLLEALPAIEARSAA
jgi:excisionase family DNA binding protein